MTDFATNQAMLDALADLSTIQYVKALVSESRAVAVQTYRVIARNHDIAADILDEDCFAAIEEGRHEDAARLSRLCIQEREAAWTAHRQADAEMTAAFRARLT